MSQITIGRSIPPPFLLEGSFKTLNPGISLNVLGLEKYEAFLGAPLLRTYWEVQTVQVTFTPLLFTNNQFKKKNLNEIKFQLGIGLLKGPILNNINIFEYSTPFIAKTEEAGGRTFESLLIRKTFILELFSPITLNKSEPLGISFSISDVRTVEHVESEVLSSFFVISRPEVNVIIDQEFEPKPHGQLRA